MKVTKAFYARMVALCKRATLRHWPTIVEDCRPLQTMSYRKLHTVTAAIMAIADQDTTDRGATEVFQLLELLDRANILADAWRELDVETDTGVSKPPDAGVTTK
jgi:hypothetical protein